MTGGVDRRVTLSLEPRLTAPRWLSPAATVAAVLVALIAGACHRDRRR